MTLVETLVMFALNTIFSGAIAWLAFRVRIEARLVRLETYVKLIAQKLEVPI